MKRNRTKIIGSGLGIVGTLVALILGINTASTSFSSFAYNSIRSSDYSLTLDSSNKVTSVGDKVQKTTLGNDVTFTYSGVASSTTGHVTLNANGTLVNKDHVRSITSFTCTYSSGTITAQLSYGGDVWNSAFAVTSGQTYETGSHPYFIKFTATSASVISSIQYKYSCIENSDAHEGEEAGEDVITYVKVTDEGNYVDGNEHVVLIVCESEGKAFDGSLTNLDVTDNGYSVQIDEGTIAYSADLATREFSIDSEGHIQSASGYYIGNTANSNSLATSTSTQYTNSIYVYSDGEAKITSSGGSILRYNAASDQSRFKYFKSGTYTNQQEVSIYEKVVTQTGPSFDEPDAVVTGFSVTSKTTEFKHTDVFDTANGLVVVANMSDGTQVPLTRGEGANNYSYVVTDNNNEVIDTSAPFGGIALSSTYSVSLRYKNYIPSEYEITVNYAKVLEEITVDTGYTEFSTAQSLSDFTSGITVDLKYNKTGYNKTGVKYEEFSTYDISLVLLNPSGVTHTISTPFGVEGTWTIKVVSNEDAEVFGEVAIHVSPIPVETVTVTGASASVEAESTLQLTASVAPNNATVQTVNWSSSNTSVATVNNNGLVTGVAAGEARITATATDGSQVFGYIDVTVTPKPATMTDTLVRADTGVACPTTGYPSYQSWSGVSKNSGAIYAGQSASNKDSSDQEYIQLRSNNNNSGIITTKSGGKISKIVVDWNSKTYNGNTMNVYGKTTSYSSPEDLYDSDSGTLIGTIVCGTSTELTITGDYTYVGLRSNEYTLYINSISFIWGEEEAPAPVYPSSITLSASSNSISVGSTTTLTVGYYPSDVNVKNVTFSSNNTNVATVANTGIVTGVAAGNARITATAETNGSGGTTTAYVDITVNAVAVTSVTLNKHATSLIVGASETLTATIAPSNAGNKNVTWSSNNESVATVLNGVITGVAAGTATITATSASNSSIKDTCSVTVTASGGNGGSGGTSGTATIAVSDIPTTYSTTSGATTCSGYTFTCYNIASSYTKGAMQWKKSSGYLANTEPMDGLVSITIDSFSGKDFSGTLYSGTSSNPSGNSQSVSSGHTYTFNGSPSYFKLEVNSSTGYTGDIELTYSTTPIDPTSISINPSSVELSPGGSKDLSINYTPSNANQNKDVTWSKVAGGSSNISVSSAGKVSVTSNASAGNTATIKATLNSDASIYATCSVTVVEQAQDDQTILLYICGSDLESNGQTSASSAAGYASGDITEILKVAGQPDDVNVVIETGGAKCWKTTHGINKSYLERYHVANKQLVRDSQETKANMGLASTLQSFVTWGVQTYPADRISLILWNHGGAMRGVCYDENFSSDCLTNSEVKTAIGNSFTSLGRSTSDKFEWIGYDACLMQVQDIAEFNSNYFNYMIASEESEAGAGWDYDNWVDDAYANKSTPEILKAIVDSFIAEQGSNSDQTLSYLDLSYMATYKSAWETMSSTVKPLISNKSTFQTMAKTVQYYGTDSDCEGYSYFGIFDAKDFLNKLKSNYSGASTQITAALNAFANLVVYSKAGKQAGNSYGLCCFFPMKDGSGYTCNTSSVYTSSQTNFTNWRSIVTSYGD